MTDESNPEIDWTAEFMDLAVRKSRDVLFVAIDRPETRNALTETVRNELDRLVSHLETDVSIRALVLESSNGIFCSGGDLKAFGRSTVIQAPQDGSPDPVRLHNRSYGTFLERFNRLPQVTIASIEGPAMAGALGIICVCDVVIALSDAKFGMTETSLGILPAQIAPFVVARIGLPATRVIALTGRRFGAEDAVKFGLVDYLCASKAEVDEIVKDIIQGVLRCAPGANAVTKQLLNRAASGAARSDTLDWASEIFADAMRGEEGQEGVNAFLEKRRPRWAR